MSFQWILATLFLMYTSWSDWQYLFNAFRRHISLIIFLDISDLQHFNVCWWLISVEHTRHCLEENKSQVVHFHLSLRSHIFNRSSIVVPGCHTFQKYFVLVLLFIYILNTFSSLAAFPYLWYSGPWVIWIYSKYGSGSTFLRVIHVKDGIFCQKFCGWIFSPSSNTISHFLINLRVKCT